MLVHKPKPGSEEHLKNWKSMGLIWDMDSEATWQKEPYVAQEGAKRPTKSIHGDPLDNKYRAVWAPEIHYVESTKNWYIVACLNNSANGKGSFILESTTGKAEVWYPYLTRLKTTNRVLMPDFPKVDTVEVFCDVLERFFALC